jgi:hypothetical protein
MLLPQVLWNIQPSVPLECNGIFRMVLVLSSLTLHLYASKKTDQLSSSYPTVQVSVQSANTGRIGTSFSLFLVFLYYMWNPFFSSLMF